MIWSEIAPCVVAHNSSESRSASSVSWPGEGLKDLSDRRNDPYLNRTPERRCLRIAQAICYRAFVKHLAMAWTSLTSERKTRLSLEPKLRSFCYKLIRSQYRHGRSRAAVVIEPVSADGLRKTGTFADKAGDGDFPLGFAKPGERRRNGVRESRDFRSILAFLGEPGRTPDWLAGAGGFEPHMAISKSDALACSRGATEPHSTRLHKPLETFEFREPYRIRRVQSFGEKWDIRRRMSRLCRLEVWSSDQKWLLILGLLPTFSCGE